MKIGIVTFQRSKNYGGILQAYALYNTISKFGHSVKMVDYWPEYRKEMQYIFPPNFGKLRLMKKITALLRYLLTARNLKIKNKRFDDFSFSFLNLKGNFSISNGNDVEEFFDVCFYGSDQVWRSYKLDSFNGIDDFYFGKFPKNCDKKVSYAASMGSLNHDEETFGKIGLLLKNFNSISVREISVKEFLKSNFNINSILVCDPTFLLDKKTWLEITPTKRIVSKKYILFYNLMPSALGSLVAKEIARKYNLTVVELSHNLINSAFENRVSSSAGPLEFLNFVNHADFVVSTSFHGMAFSIIFEKQFYALGMNEKSDRALTALRFLDVSDRYINNYQQLDLSKKINYKNVNEKLKVYKEESLSFIENNLVK